jgi:hypothetical protein
VSARKWFEATIKGGEAVVLALKIVKQPLRRLLVLAVVI